MAVLKKQEVEARLESRPGWKRHDDEIRREYRFADFKEAMAFVNRVAQLADAADHHPDIDVRYNRVKLSLATHSEGGVTERDLDLAAQIDTES